MGRWRRKTQTISPSESIFPDINFISPKGHRVGWGGWRVVNLMLNLQPVVILTAYVVWNLSTVACTHRDNRQLPEKEECLTVGRPTNKEAKVQGWLSVQCITEQKELLAGVYVNVGIAWTLNYHSCEYLFIRIVYLSWSRWTTNFIL